MGEELKQLGTGYAEKVASLSDAMRRKNGNLLVTDLNNVLKPQDMSKVTVHDTDYLVTVFVAVPKVLQDNFLKEVRSGNLGSEIAGYGGPDWSRNGSDLGRAINYGKDVDRKAKSGSPIVPDTLRLVKEDDDSVLYAVTILKGQIEVSFQSMNMLFRILYYVAILTYPLFHSSLGPLKEVSLLRDPA